MSGLFGGLFDFNNNGKTDPLELAAALLFFDKTTSGERSRDDDPFTEYGDEDGEPDDDSDAFDEDELDTDKYDD